jgi:hypothetical protein
VGVGEEGVEEVGVGACGEGVIVVGIRGGVLLFQGLRGEGVGRLRKVEDGQRAAGL